MEISIRNHEQVHHKIQEESNVPKSDSSSEDGNPLLGLVIEKSAACKLAVFDDSDHNKDESEDKVDADTREE
jgi:hypothetical protein